MADDPSEFSWETKQLMISFLEGQSKATKTPCFQTYKERRDRLKALLVRGSSGRIGDSGHGRAIMFWSSMRKILDKNEYQQFKNWNNSRCKAEQRAYNKNVFGLTSEGFKKDVAARNKFDFNSKLVQHRPDTGLSFIPIRSHAKIKQKLLTRLQSLEEKLVAHFEGSSAQRLRGGAGNYQSDARDSNRGKSLSHTVVSGGQYANKRNDISGSVHLNSNLKTARALQEEVNEVITEIVENSFGPQPWYMLLKFLLKDIPADRFIGTASTLPCSHIWWTRDPKSFHVHCDNNTIGAAFIFCANTVEGGSLVIQTPDGSKHTKHLKAGEILGGSWAQYAHCNEPTEYQRRSFVVYLDYRVLSSSYISKCG
jgi:hypothetical protein